MNYSYQKIFILFFFSLYASWNQCAFSEEDIISVRAEKLEKIHAEHLYFLEHCFEYSPLPFFFAERIVAQCRLYYKTEIKEIWENCQKVEETDKEGNKLVCALFPKKYWEQYLKISTKLMDVGIALSNDPQKYIDHVFEVSTLQQQAAIEAQKAKRKKVGATPTDICALQKFLTQLSDKMDDKKMEKFLAQLPEQAQNRIENSSEINHEEITSQIKTLQVILQMPDTIVETSLKSQAKELLEIREKASLKKKGASLIEQYKKNWRNQQTVLQNSQNSTKLYDLRKNLFILYTLKNEQEALHLEMLMVLKQLKQENLDRDIKDKSNREYTRVLTRYEDRINFLEKEIETLISQKFKEIDSGEVIEPPLPECQQAIKYCKEEIEELRKKFQRRTLLIETESPFLLKSKQYYFFSLLTLPRIMGISAGIFIGLVIEKKTSFIKSRLTQLFLTKYQKLHAIKCRKSCKKSQLSKNRALFVKGLSYIIGCTLGALGGLGSVLLGEKISEKI